MLAFKIISLAAIVQVAMAAYQTYVCILGRGDFGFLTEICGTVGGGADCAKSNSFGGSVGGHYGCAIDDSDTAVLTKLQNLCTTVKGGRLLKLSATCDAVQYADTHR